MVEVKKKITEAREPTDEERKILERSQLAKEFTESSLWKEYLKPHLTGRFINSWPDPREDGWQDKYKTAWAWAMVGREFVGLLEIWIQQGEAVKKALKEGKKAKTFEL